MKVGLHLSMLCDTWLTDTSKYFEDLKSFGFDGVELSLFGSTPEKLRGTVQKARDCGLEVAFGTGIGCETDISSEDEAIRKAGVEYLKGCVAFAEECEIPFINGVLYAPWQAFSKSDKKQRWQRSADCLLEVASTIKTDLKLHLEVINRFESDFMNTLAEGTEFLQMCGSGKLKLLADTFHMNIEEDNITKAVEDNFSSLGCIHVCENHRGVPGTGHIPFEELIGALKKKDYQGFLIIESFVESGTEVGDALFIWQDKNLNALTEAGKGVKHLKKIIG